MKKLLFILFVSAVFSCNSEKKDAVPSGNDEPGVKNVNGNIPDSTNSINISGNKTDSTTSIDSTHVK